MELISEAGRESAAGRAVYSVDLWVFRSRRQVRTRFTRHLRTVYASFARGSTGCVREALFAQLLGNGQW